ncbi:hypothetical protein AA15669_1498 [Saccharibacter floricola DSM 15669]|uniref:Uncharacterized protein n=1 Tax=Saccharibacter floricola DSM 15669 TaxID=1123227 RepID=A0ABQ0P0B8_9PROT|nr:hypothetical protein AA15669_1498 [Saccharibacter floricola DSM 15669]
MWAPHADNPHTAGENVAMDEVMSLSDGQNLAAVNEFFRQGEEQVNHPFSLTNLA